MLENIRIVLLNTTHPGNIGATARAMMNMSLSRLVLVAPKHFPNPEAESRASGATEILDNALTVSTLDEAIADCQLVIGTSARQRSLPLQVISPRECARMVSKEASSSQVAILFGEERIGLTNEQIDKCHYQIMIPANDNYCSLNLAAAVQLIAYELRMTCLDIKTDEKRDDDVLATAAEMESFYQHLQTVMTEKEFFDPDTPKRLMPKLRRLFTRARPEQQEVNILRGILTAITGNNKS